MTFAAFPIRTLADGLGFEDIYARGPQRIKSGSVGVMPKRQPKPQSFGKQSNRLAKKTVLTPVLTSVDTNVKISEGRLPTTIAEYLRGRAVKKIVVYLRVSTKKQGESGLGLAAQRSDVDKFVQARGCEVLAEYQEVESGKRSDRPQLGKALAHAKRSKALLVVAKLDRLARNVAFLSALMDSGAEFVALDVETANRFTLHILAAVAEQEARAISDRTKKALAEVKKKGTPLGSARPGHWDGRETDRLAGLEKGRAKSIETRQAKAMSEYADLVPMMRELRAAGKKPQGIADELNAQGHTTRRGKPWNHMQVMRVLDRAKSAN